MATYTSNYGLHQWAPEDNFLRTDFNQDLEKIDTALGQKAEGSTVDALENQVEKKAELVIGSYTGNGASQVIELGFRPSFVHTGDGIYFTSANAQYSSQFCGITDTGFSVSWNSGYPTSINRPNMGHSFAAFR